MPRAATTSPRAPWTGTATPVSPTSSSSRVTAQPRLRVRAPSRRSVVGVDDGGVGEPLEPGLRDRQRAPRVEDLAERGGVRRHLDLGPVAGAEQEARVDLGDLDDLLAAGHREVHGLVGLLADPLHGRPGQPDQLLPRVVPGGVQPEQAARDVGAGRGRARAARRARGRRASARSWTWRARSTPGGRRRSAARRRAPRSTPAGRRGRPPGCRCSRRPRCSSWASAGSMMWNCGPTS